MRDLLRRILPYLMADGADGGGSTETPTQEPSATPPEGNGDSPPTEGSSELGWRRILPKSFQDLKEAQGAQNVTEYLEGLYGKAVDQPAVDAPDEEWDRYHEKMGGATSPDDYRLPQIDGVEDDQFEKFFRDTASNMRLTPRQARRFYDAFAARFAEQSQAVAEMRTKAREDATKNLREEWGDQYDARLELANRTFKTLTSEQDYEALKERDLLNDPVMIKMFAKYGDMISEDNLTGGRPEGAGDGLRDVNPATGHRRFVFKSD